MHSFVGLNQCMLVDLAGTLQYALQIVAPFTLKSAPAQTLNHRVAVPSAHMGRPLGRVSISAATYTPGAWKAGSV